MENPYKRPAAADLIGQELDDYEEMVRAYPDLCGFSREMTIYMALKNAGYLTEAAMVPNEN